MSTRATYLIDGHAFYIHHDGYLSGAASYFALAVVHPRESDGLAGKFYCANDCAEFTKGHSHHGDGEYRYTYVSQTDTLTAERRNMGDERGLCVFRVVFVGSLATFLAQHEEERKAKQWTRAYGTALPLDVVRERARKHLAYFEHHKSNGWTGNASSILHDIRRGLAGLDPATILGDDWTQARAWYLEKFPHMADYLDREGSKV